MSLLPPRARTCAAAANGRKTLPAPRSAAPLRVALRAFVRSGATGGGRALSIGLYVPFRARARAARADGGPHRDAGLSATVPNDHLFVDDVVAALTGAVDTRGDARSALKAQMQRATDEFDQRTAEAFARALLESLCEEPIDLRKLEALLILGLAHPSVLDRHRISLAVEGRRLAAMLERKGEIERARVLLEVVTQHESGALGRAAPQPAATPPAASEDDIQRYLAIAEKAASRGRTNEAIRALQEVVALDRNRRDVARMIRDLRFADKDRRARLVRRLKAFAVLCVLGAIAAGVVWRERSLADRWATLPARIEGDRAAVQRRLDAIDAFVASQRLWIGLPEALRETAALRTELTRLDEAEARRKHEEAVVRSRAFDLCEAARSRGLALAQEGKFEAALVDLKQALALADPAWAHRGEVQSNIDAIEKWLARSR